MANNHQEQKPKKETKEPEQPVKPVDNEPVILSKEDYDLLKQDADKAKENWDALLRQRADFENIRKRMEREKQEFQKYASEELVAELLGVLDDLERSVDAAEKGQENFEAFLKGIEMILAHLYELIKKRGVAPIDAKGKKFDPLEHEALIQTESSDHDDDEVIEEMQKGYKIGDRVIRTSKVRVAKKIIEDKK